MRLGVVSNLQFCRNTRVIVRKALHTLRRGRRPRRPACRQHPWCIPAGCPEAIPYGCFHACHCEERSDVAICSLASISPKPSTFQTHAPCRAGACPRRQSEPITPFFESKTAALHYCKAAILFPAIIPLDHSPEPPQQP